MCMFVISRKSNDFEAHYCNSNIACVAPIIADSTIIKQHSYIYTWLSSHIMNDLCQSLLCAKDSLQLLNTSIQIIFQLFYI